ncbi:MAG: hypothetical protein ABIH20_00770 [Candidatus Diapherotrites archaeon]
MAKRLRDSKKWFDYIMKSITSAYPKQRQRNKSLDRQRSAHLFELQKKADELADSKGTDSKEHKRVLAEIKNVDSTRKYHRRVAIGIHARIVTDTVLKLFDYNKTLPARDLRDLRKASEDFLKVLLPQAKGMMSKESIIPAVRISSDKFVDAVRPILGDTGGLEYYSSIGAHVFGTDIGRSPKIVQRGNLLDAEEFFRRRKR